MRITEELFVLPDGADYLLYVATTGKVLRTTSGVVRTLQDFQKGLPISDRNLRRELQRHGILVRGTQPTPRAKQSTSSFRPTAVTLFPTTECNLRCVYCYGSAGENHFHMSWELAKAAMDLVVRNALGKKRRKIAIDFHGGGEPFHGRAWELVQRSLRYAKTVAKKNDLRVTFTSGTNGVLSDDKLAWIVRNLDFLFVSLDGPPDIQNAQRPTKNGGATFPAVLRTLQYLDRHDFNYWLRPTITRESCARMGEILRFFVQICKRRSFLFEPLIQCGRCHTTDARSPDPDSFLRSYVDVLKYARELGVQIQYSGIKPGKIATRFCGAAGKNFLVTPWGDVTSCNEVCLPSDPRAKVFFYGRYDTADKKFHFDHKKLNYLRSRVIQNLSDCRDCFAKYSCAGDCPAKTFLDNDGDIMRTRNNTRCDINRRLLLEEIRSVLPK